jgi:hypothetical protein
VCQFFYNEPIDDYKFWHAIILVGQELKVSQSGPSAQEGSGNKNFERAKIQRVVACVRHTDWQAGKLTNWRAGKLIFSWSYVCHAPFPT